MRLWIVAVLVVAILAPGIARPSVKKIREDLRDAFRSPHVARSRFRRSGGSCHLIVLLDNNLDRTIKIIPSQSSHGAYFVEPRGFLQVNITIACGGAGIQFSAVDQEKQLSVLLNSQQTITIAPTSDPKLVHSVKITPQALKVIPSRSYDLNQIDSTGTILGYPDLHGHSVTEEALGLSLDGVSSYIDGTLPGADCALNPGNCPDGFTISTKFVVDSSVQGNLNDQYVIDTGAKSGTTTGLSLYLINGTLYYELRTASKKWKIQLPSLSFDSEKYYIFTWRESSGLLAYANSLLVATDASGVNENVTQHGQVPNIAIGRNAIGTTYSYGEFIIASMTTFNQFIEDQDISNIYMFLWSSYMTRGYYARIRTVNIGQRSARLNPDRGHADGFLLEPYKALEILLVDLSTTTESPQAVHFNATDEASGMQLLLNGTVNSVAVTPVESPKDFVNLIATVQVPATSPRYTWPTVAISNGQVATTPPLTVHGNVQVVSDTFAFDGVSSYLDAGSLAGECLTDPSKCSQGFTLGLKVKFPMGAASYSAPKVVFDSGSYTGKGISVYLQNETIHAVVALGSVLYRVSSPVKTDSWLAISVQYKSDVGIILVDDDQTVLTSNTSIPHIGTGKPANVTIGREASGMPSTYASFFSEIFVFYETMLPPNELAKMAVYYYSYATNVALTRFSNVNFVNLAGKEVRIYPDKGDNQQNGYTLPAGTIMELRSSEQGTGSLFPITYSAEDPITSDTVYMDKQPSFLAVQNHDNSTVIIVELTNNY